MKRNLLLLAVMILVAFGFSSLSVAQCPEAPNDLGECDTLHLAVWETDDALPKAEGPPWFIRVNIRVTHDLNIQPDGKPDSLAGFAIPLRYEVVESFGDVEYCSLSGYWNNNKLLPSAKVVRSVFRHMPDMDTPTEYNWMMKLSEEEDPEWDYVDVNMSGNTHMGGLFLISLAPTGGADRRFADGDRVLLATLTFKLDLDDSCDVYIDTSFWPPTTRISFARSDANTYIPRMDWKSSRQDTGQFHFRPWIIPNEPPYFSICPPNEEQYINGSFQSQLFEAKDDLDDPDGLVTSVTATYVGDGGASVPVPPGDITFEPGFAPPATVVKGKVNYTVTNHCLNGGVVTLTCVDDASAQNTVPCTFNIDLKNHLPACTPPADYTGAYNVLMVSTPFTCTDEDGDATTMSIIDVQPTPCMNYPTIVGDHVEWVGDCCDDCVDYTVTLQCTDFCEESAEPQTFNVHFTNATPTVVCPDDVEEYWSLGDPPLQSGDFDANDPENEPLIISVSSGGLTFNDPVIVGSHVEWTPTEDELCLVFTMTVTVEDECGEQATCTFTMHGKEITGRMAAVVVPNKVYERFYFGHWDYFPWDVPGYDPQDPETWNDNYIISDDACPPYGGINPGNWFEIPIILEGFGDITGVYIGGFELEVEFDFIDLTFYGAMRGCLLSQRWYEEAPGPPIDSILYSWEYFTYRVLPCTELHKYKILLFGQADMPDGELRRGYSLGDGDLEHSFWCGDVTEAGDEIGASLVWLKFRVANNELLRDLKLPVFFEWEHKLSAEPPYYIIQDWDCAENTMSDPTGNILYVSNDPMQYSLSVCGDDVVDTLEFVDGGVHICSPCTSFACVRGDINVDGISYTTADAVLFARYFVEGLVVFGDERDEAVCASDVNADGRTLMLADLVYLIRVILQVAPEIPKLGPSSEVVNVIVYDNIITTECASPISAILFEFDGAVVPTLLADMEMVNKGNKVLVWSRDGETITTAEVLSFIGDAELVSVTAVDYDTRDLQTSITVKVAPTAFALNPAYPNPFNPFTNLSFTLPEALNYNLKIYNVAGQLVRSYEGMGSAGLNVITWDAKDHAGLEVASGVYFYKLTAAGFSATEKMVMMK